MFKLLQHGFNLVKHTLRDVKVGTQRSGKWRAVEQHFLEAHPTCEACGSKTRLNAHHIEPFHINPALELDTNNLITLCMSRKECHLHIGHLGNFKHYNPNVRHDAAVVLKNPERFQQIIKLAMEKNYPGT